MSAGAVAVTGPAPVGPVGPSPRSAAAAPASRPAEARRRLRRDRPCDDVRRRRTSSVSEMNAAASTPSAISASAPIASSGRRQRGVGAMTVRAGSPQRRHHSWSLASSSPQRGQGARLVDGSPAARRRLGGVLTRGVVRLAGRRLGAVRPARRSRAGASLRIETAPPVRASSASPSVVVAGADAGEEARAGERQAAVRAEARVAAVQRAAALARRHAGDEQLRVVAALAQRGAERARLAVDRVDRRDLALDERLVRAAGSDAGRRRARRGRGSRARGPRAGSAAGGASARARGSRACAARAAGSYAPRAARGCGLGAPPGPSRRARSPARGSGASTARRGVVGGVARALSCSVVAGAVVRPAALGGGGVVRVLAAGCRFRGVAGSDGLLARRTGARFDS